MKSARLIFIASLLTFAVVRPAEGLTMTTVIRGEAPEKQAKVELIARRVDGTSIIERTILVPGTEQLVELADGNWELSIRSPLFWASPAVVSAGQPASLVLWPAGEVRAIAKAADRGVKISELRIAFAPVMGAAPDEYPSGVSVCGLDGEQARCVVPAGICDLRVLSTGYAAEFRWQKKIAAGKLLDLGPVMFRRGASLIGFVSAARGVDADMAEVVVVAEPRGSAMDAKTRRYSTRANARGFFQIAGLIAGDYVVFAEAKRLRSEDRPATILEDRNAELRSPLILDWPRRIALTITSSRNNNTSRWRVRLLRIFPEAGRAEDALTGVADKDGNWNAEVVPGQYLLQISRGDGSVWHSADVEVAATDVYRSIFIPVTTVFGRVRLGDEPLSDAKIVFGSERESEQIRFVTNTDGEFQGEIPEKTADGPLTWRISVTSENPSVQRASDYVATKNDDGSLTFEIELPRTVVRGRVVKDDGMPERATVTLRSPDGQVFEQAFAGSDGRFELHGFEPGIYRIQASAFQRSSDIMDIQASENETKEVEIVLRKTVRVIGRVQSRSATGLSAKLIALQREVRTTFIPSATTDAEGRFELILPPQTRSFDLVVNAPGFAVSTGRVVIQDDKALTLTVDQIGGSLTIIVPRGAEAMIRHDGAEFLAGFLVAEAGGTVQEGENTDSITLPNVEVGEYAICLGAICRSGFVPPRGSVELSMP